MTAATTIELERGTVLLDPEDLDRLAHAVYLGHNGYAYFSIWQDGASRPVTLHSFVMGGARPGHHIDHINGDKLDNRKANLRFVSHQTNQVNRKQMSKANTSGIRGVAYRPDLSRKNPWHAQISANRRTYHLGLFATEEEAVAARRRAEVEHFGEVCP